MLHSLVPLLLFFGLAASLSPPSEYLFTNPPENVRTGFKIPSIREAAVQARRILYLESIATFSTVFPPASTNENRPNEVASTPIGLMEYYAQCAPEVYNPTIIAITIATTMKNAAAGSNVTLSLRYHLPSDAVQPPPDLWAYIPANLPRFSLTGYIERFSDDDVEVNNISSCFFSTHPESKIWAPGSDVHDAWWGRLIVREIYYFGGFGDRSRISWIPLEVWQNITQEEVQQYRMVGEPGYTRKNVIEGDDIKFENPESIQGDVEL